MLQALLQSQFDSAFGVTRQQVGRVLVELASTSDAMDAERNVCNYVWEEGQGDIVTNMAWIPASQKTLGDSGALMMKAKAYTPAVQR